MKLYEIFIDNRLDYEDNEFYSKLIVANSLKEAEIRAKNWMKEVTNLVMKGCLLMKNNSFKLICDNCGNMAELKNNTSNEDYSGKFSFYPIQNERISIYCQKCDNEVFIDEDYFMM
ncbi:hypothetical protein NST17_20070 [Caldifermentibacillus hisashii]|uniref:Uncharacterized protein n=1 Tax=Caldifermentibacillus hisashii TaxID=996558 RepID=A0ABU9K2V5_9BACI